MDCCPVHRCLRILSNRKNPSSRLTNSRADPKYPVPVFINSSHTIIGQAVLIIRILPVADGMNFFLVISIEVVTPDANSQLSEHRLPESKGKKCQDIGYQ